MSSLEDVKLVKQHTFSSRERRGQLVVTTLLVCEGDFCKVRDGSRFRDGDGYRWRFVECRDLCYFLYFWESKYTSRNVQPIFSCVSKLHYAFILRTAVEKM